MQQEQEQEQDLSKVTVGIKMPLLINTLSEFLFWGEWGQLPSRLMLG